MCIKYIRACYFVAHRTQDELT